MHISQSKARSKSGFTLVEIMYAGTICVMVTGMALGTLLAMLRAISKDAHRLDNNSSLRGILNTVSLKAVDSTEFFLFPNYAVFNGNLILSTGDPWPTDSSIAEPYDNTFGSQTADGDCLVLIARANTSSTAPVTALHIFYRLTTNSNTQAPLRLYEKIFDPASPDSPTTILNGVDLSLAPGGHGNVTVTELAKNTIGRKGPTDHYPIFATEVPFPTPAQANVSINVEVVNGTNQNDKLSSSSFNYIVSPRK